MRGVSHLPNCPFAYPLTNTLKILQRTSLSMPRKIIATIAFCLFPCLLAAGGWASEPVKEPESLPLLTVRVLAVQGMDDDGGRACKISINEVKALVAEANRIYEPARVQFVFRGDGEDFVQLRNTRINSLMPGNRQADPEKQAPDIGTSQERHQAAAQFAARHPDCMVVFFRYGDKRKGATGGGYSGSRAKFVVMPGLRSTNMGLRGLAHEAGHYLGLRHTFGRSFPSVEAAEKYLREHDNDLSVFDGDKLSDTPPDPRLGGGKDSIELNGISVSLPRGNIMSYRRWDHHEWLSPQQAKIVRANVCRRFGDKPQEEMHSGCQRNDYDSLPLRRAFRRLPRQHSFFRPGHCCTNRPAVGVSQDYGGRRTAQPPLTGAPHFQCASSGKASSNPSSQGFTCEQSAPMRGAGS
jgi:hypothetical protein